MHFVVEEINFVVVVEWIDLVVATQTDFVIVMDLKSWFVGLGTNFIVRWISFIVVVVDCWIGFAMGIGSHYWIMVIEERVIDWKRFIVEMGTHSPELEIIRLIRLIRLAFVEELALIKIN